jgi:hypothetical protein
MHAHTHTHTHMHTCWLQKKTLVRMHAHTYTHMHTHLEGNGIIVLASPNVLSHTTVCAISTNDHIHLCVVAVWEERVCVSVRKC